MPVSAGELLDTAIATTPAAGDEWVWNGWESSTHIARIDVTGNGILDGFIWFDGEMRPWRDTFGNAVRVFDRAGGEVRLSEALDHANGLVVFVEVKTRSGTEFGGAAAAVSEARSGASSSA